MLRTRLGEGLAASLIAIAVVCPAAAQERHEHPPGALFDMPLPGGLRGAMQAVGDPISGDRGQFLVDCIRRFYSAPAGPQQAGGQPLRSLVAYLEASNASPGTMDAVDAEAAGDTLPLPLPPAVWTGAVFGGRATPRTLLSAIVQSRSAALLYYGLLSLDDDTRAWLAGQQDLVSEIASRHAAAFVLAAPALRVAGGSVRVPGGAAAEPSWEALVGSRVSEPAAFMRALLAREAHLAYFFGSMAPLTPGQVRLALDLDAPEARNRIAAAERLLAVFERIATGWDVRLRTFWRPAADPALLMADLRVDAGGRTLLPGTQRFWNLVFAESAPRDGELDASELVEGAPVTFAWLCDHVFRTDLAERRRRYRAVLFASRLAGRITTANIPNAIVAAHATAEYPALTAVLERAGLNDPGIISSAARRAAQLSGIGDEVRAVRSITQFQGTLAILVRAASRLALSREKLAGLVSSLCSVTPGERGDYEGALVSWVDTHLGGHTAGKLDADVLQLVTGPAPMEPRLVEWEGTRYRVDLSHGEARRMAGLLGEAPPPYLQSAVRLFAAANAVDAAGQPLDGVRRQLTDVARAVGWEEGDAWPPDVSARYRAADAALQRIPPARDPKARRVLARALRVLADDLLARGLIELSYAAALGQPDRAWVTAGDVARRHLFDLRSFSGRGAVWEVPFIKGTVRPGISLTGSLLALDVALAELALVRLSLKPPPRQPMLGDVNRRTTVEAIALVGSMSLTDRDRDEIAAALRRGRERVAALRTTDDARTLAEELRLSPVRASLLPWVVSREPARVSAFLSLGEILRLGIRDVPDDSTLHAWGAPAGSRLGCLCLQLPRREPWEIVAGRWGSGMLMSTFPDLNLRLAELLSEMQMPASLLGPVLASATLDFVTTTISRDEDDRRGLIEYVNTLDRERLEQYLALLTTDGPLVPLDAVEDALATGVSP